MPKLWLSSPVGVRFNDNEAQRWTKSLAPAVCCWHRMPYLTGRPADSVGLESRRNAASRTGVTSENDVAHAGAGLAKLGRPYDTDPTLEGDRWSGTTPGLVMPTAVSPQSPGQRCLTNYRR